MMSRNTSIQIINQLLDFLSGQAVPESDFPVSQLIERGNVRHAHKEVSSFATPLLSPNTTARNRTLSGFWSGRFFLSWWFVGAVCWPLLNRLSVVSRRKGWCRIPAVLNPKTSSATEYNVGFQPCCPLLLPSVCWEL
jgi:hypothetical protein